MYNAEMSNANDPNVHLSIMQFFMIWHASVGFGTRLLSIAEDDTSIKLIWFPERGLAVPRAPFLAEYVNITMIHTDKDIETFAQVVAERMRSKYREQCQKPNS